MNRTDLYLLEYTNRIFQKYIIIPAVVHLSFIPKVILVFKNKLLTSITTACKYQYSVEKHEHAHCGQFLNGSFCRTGLGTAYFHVIGSSFKKQF